MPNERVILIGAGGIAGAWLPNIVREQLDVVAVVDVRREQAQKRIEEFGLAGAVAFDDLDTALRDVRADFAIDLTIPEAHHDVTIKCLCAGLHVVGEKPMAATMEQAKRMVQVARETGKLFMVSQSRRWEAKHATIQHAIAAGKIGALTTLNCDFYIGAHFGGFRDAMASPLVVDMAIHHFDLARHFSGRDPTSVYCEEWNTAGSWYAGDASATCLFHFDDNVRFNFRGSWNAEGCPTSWNGDWRFIGTQGTILYAGDKEPAGQVVDPSQTGFHLPKTELVIDAVPQEKTTFAASLDAMLKFLRTGERPSTHCEDNIKSLAMVFAALQSSREKRRVRLDELLT